MENQTSSNISLDAITVSTTNELFRRPRELTKEALEELSSSIVQYGVIQPVLVRPNPQVPGGYILICGERRYRASLLAGKNDVPAYVRDVSHEVALVLQITENVQREDVHALNEAKGYKIILENDKSMTTAELALKFGKSETYILQRLKLNDLVKEAKKDFYADNMHLGHALLLARLTPQDQREVIKRIVDNQDGYGTVSELDRFIERNIVNSLLAAPFDKNDTGLYKKAGACSACAKRSGASPLLFAEIKEKDKCFDRNCFFIKCQRFLVNRTREVIETNPDIVFLVSYHAPVEEISQMLIEHNIKPLKEYDDFNEHNHGGRKVKGIWISGDKAGHMVSVYLKKDVAAASANETEDGKVLIGKIQQRMARGKELDREKVYGKILEGLKDHPTQKEGHGKKLMPDEEVLLWFIIFDKAGYNVRRELRKFIGWKKETPEDLYRILKKMTPEHKAFMLRKVMLDQYGGNYPESCYGLIIRKIAEGYRDIDIAAFEKEQAEVQEKRETRAKERIRLLKKGLAIAK
ncbi:MAG TPA: ParB/RepB/Spo0J family partition protein [Chryseolinea sp.]|nr:ParB/RepB/Spo0J family partition protein [Chryseolinea sp.]